VDRSKEDALWRAIVENYGDRADLDAPTTDRTTDLSATDGAATDGPGNDGPASGGTGVGTAEPAADVAEAPPGGRPTPAGPGGPGTDGGDHEAARAAEAARREREFEAQHEVPERFVPPEPPPLPYVPPARLLAWCLMVGGPVLLLLSLVLDFWLPGIIQVLAVAGFVGGFVYLVLQMPRDPRDPWDDGARV